MQTKIKTLKSGAWTTFDKHPANGMYEVKVYAPSGSLHDKVRCDDYREALAYLKSFNAIGKQL